MAAPPALQEPWPRRSVLPAPEHDEPLAVPRLLLDEVANALLMAIGRGRWSGVEADAAAALVVGRQRRRNSASIRSPSEDQKPGTAGGLRAAEATHRAW